MLSLSETVRTVLLICAMLGSAGAGGIFLAFSNFVMPAFRRIPPAHAEGAMTAINEAAKNPFFALIFFGTAAQDRPVKLMRAEGITTMEEANRYLDQHWKLRSTRPLA